MSKKKNEVEVMSVPTTDQVIDTSIDMKLSKQDLIDVVVEETRERLEAQVADARDAFEEEKNAVAKEHSTLKKLFIDAVEKKFAKEIKALKANGEVGNPSINESSTSWGRNGLVATEHGLVDANSLEQQNVRTSRGHYGHRTTTQNGKIVLFSMSLPQSYESKSQNAEDVDDEEDNGRKQALCVIQMSLQLRLTKAEARKLYAPFSKLVEHLGETQTTLSKLEEQLKAVDKMGKKAKTQLIKRILESSEGGQALLSNIGAIKANCAQLLLEATK